MDNTLDVMNSHLLGLDRIADCAITDVKMTQALRTGSFGPIDAALVVIVIVNRSGAVRISQRHVGATSLKGEYLFDTFISSPSFSFSCTR